MIWTDSCEDMLIEDCYISVGDDAIAIKSGWDQYGITYGRPSKNIVIRNLVVRSNVRWREFLTQASCTYCMLVSILLIMFAPGCSHILLFLYVYFRKFNYLLWNISCIMALDFAESSYCFESRKHKHCFVHRHKFSNLCLSIYQNIHVSHTLVDHKFWDLVSLQYK